MPFRLFSMEEAAHYLHISRQDLESLVKREEIPFEQQGNRVLFRKKEVDGWASQRILGLQEKPLKAYHRATSKRMLDLSANHAIMPDLIQTAFILPELHSKTKTSVLRDMVLLAEKTERLMDPQDLLVSLQEREKLCSTALPGGIALLHPRHHDPYMFTESFLALGRAIHAVPFGAPDGKRSDLFFLLCCQDDRVHLHVLARLCSLCHNTTLVPTLRAAASAEEMRDAILATEREVIQNL